VGGVIDNKQLDIDINDDVDAQDSKLGKVDNDIFSGLEFIYSNLFTINMNIKIFIHKRKSKVQSH
jgi:hypothetical protein